MMGLKKRIPQVLFVVAVCSMMLSGCESVVKESRQEIQIKGIGWFAQASAPTPSIGKIGDVYLNTKTGLLYSRAVSGWIEVGTTTKSVDNIPQTRSVNGPAWTNGTTAPDSTTNGAVGDYYLDRSTGFLWIKKDSGWEKAIQLSLTDKERVDIASNADDAKYYAKLITGTTAPTVSVGTDKQLFLNTKSGILYVRDAETWKEIGNITIATDTFKIGNPSISTGDEGTYLLDEKDGTLYRRETGVWVKFASIPYAPQTSNVDTKGNPTEGDPLTDNVGLAIHVVPQWGHGDGQTISGTVIGLEDPTQYVAVAYTQYSHNQWASSTITQVLDVDGHFSINMAGTPGAPDYNTDVKYGLAVGVLIFKNTPNLFSSNGDAYVGYPNYRATPRLDGYLHVNSDLILVRTHLSINSYYKNTFWQMTPDARSVTDVPKAVASKYVIRDNGKRLTFSGYEWKIKDNPKASLAPYNNYFFGSNAYLDTNGDMVLKYRKVGGRWAGAEISTTFDKFGYGQYVYQVASDISKLDKQITSSLFTFANRPDLSGSYSYTELPALSGPQDLNPMAFFPLKQHAGGFNYRYHNQSNTFGVDNNPHQELNFDFSGGLNPADIEGFDGNNTRINVQPVAAAMSNSSETHLTPADTAGGVTCYLELHSTIARFKVYRGLITLAQIQNGQGVVLVSFDYTNTKYLPNPTLNSLQVRANIYHVQDAPNSPNPGLAPENGEVQTFRIRKFEYAAH